MSSNPLQRTSVIAQLLRRLNLRYPTLFLLMGGLTLVDFLVPDFIPFVDEIGLACLTILLGSWKGRKVPPPDEAS